MPKVLNTLELPGALAAATGLVVGGDTVMFRPSADVLRLTDNLVVDLSAAIGATGIASVNERLRVAHTVADAAATQFGVRSLLSHSHAAASAVGLYATSSETTVAGTGGDTGIIAAQQAQTTYQASGVGNNVNAALFYVTQGTLGGGIATARGFYTRVDNAHLTNAIANAYGIEIANNIQPGPITNNLGLFVQALAGTGTVRGIVVSEPASGAIRRAVDLSSTSGSPAGGITFGGDTTLYRSAADTLKTDDKLVAGGLQLPAGAAAGQVLTSDASGNGTWQAPASGSGALLTGTGAPAAGTGSDGAMYLDTASGRFYGPKAAGAWPAATQRLVPLAPTYAQLTSG